MRAELQRYGTAALAGVERLRIRQRKELLEVFTDWETRNRYEIDDADGNPILYAGEESSGIGAFLFRQFLGRKRPFTIGIRDLAGNVVLTVKRPWRWFFSRAEVHDGSGQLLGAIQQRFAIFARRYTLEGPGGGVGAEIHGPFFRPWTFDVRVRGNVVGRIAKRWSGLLQEAFTDADTFGVEMTPTLDERLRPLVLGATFLIDFVHFEKSR